MYKITLEIRSRYHLYSNVIVSSDSVCLPKASAFVLFKSIKSESQGEIVTQNQ